MEAETQGVQLTGHELPHQLLEELGLLLDPKELGAARSTCRAWRSHLSDRVAHPRSGGLFQLVATHFSSWQQRVTGMAASLPCLKQLLIYAGGRLGEQALDQDLALLAKAVPKLNRLELRFLQPPTDGGGLPNKMPLPAVPRGLLQMTSLTELCLIMTPVPTLDHINHLPRTLHDLHIASGYDAHGLTDVTMAALGERLPCLARLEADIGSYSVSAQGIRGLPSRLQELRLHGVLALGIDEVMAFCQSVPLLHTLAVEVPSDCHGYTVTLMRDHPRLLSLDLGYNQDEADMDPTLDDLLGSLRTLASLDCSDKATAPSSSCGSWRRWQRQQSDDAVSTSPNLSTSPSASDVPASSSLNMMEDLATVNVNEASISAVNTSGMATNEVVGVAASAPISHSQVHQLLRCQASPPYGLESLSTDRSSACKEPYTAAGDNINGMMPGSSRAEACHHAVDPSQTMSASMPPSPAVMPALRLPKHKGLTCLYLQSINIPTDTDFPLLPLLGTLTSLTSLSIAEPWVPAARTTALTGSLTELKGLSQLRTCFVSLMAGFAIPALHVTAEVIDCFAKSCPRLRALTAYNCFARDLATTAALSSLSHLESLLISPTTVPQQLGAPPAPWPDLDLALLPPITLLSLSGYNLNHSGMHQQQPHAQQACTFNQDMNMDVSEGGQKGTRHAATADALAAQQPAVVASTACTTPTHRPCNCFQGCLSRLEDLSIFNCHLGEGLQPPSLLLHACTGLHSLMLQHVTGLNDDMFSGVEDDTPFHSSMAHVHSGPAADSPATAEDPSKVQGLLTLTSSLPSCHTQPNQPTTSPLPALTRLTSLQLLAAPGTPSVTQAGLRHCSSLTALKALEWVGWGEGAQAEDEAQVVAELARGAKALHVLRLSAPRNAEVREATARVVAEQLPLCCLVSR